MTDCMGHQKRNINKKRTIHFQKKTYPTIDCDISSNQKAFYELLSVKFALELEVQYSKKVEDIFIQILYLLEST